MASDLSSGCTDSIGDTYEKEEGEISLEDVSSADEGNLNYMYGSRTAQCSTCLSSQHCASWCNGPARNYHHRNSSKKEVNVFPEDVVQGKENRHYAKESGSIGPKHSTSTLQEKNDDLMPISSDSDMEIVGLADNSKQILLRHATKTKTKKKKKKKKSHGGMLSIDDLVSPSTVDMPVPVCILKQDNIAVKADRLPRSHHREVSPVHRSVKPKMGIRSPLRRSRVQIYRRSPVRKSRSPISRVRSPQLKRSPRRVRSPRRSPYRSLGRTVSKKPSRCDHSSATPSHNFNNTHKLLKKVRQLDSVGISSEETNVKNKEHVSSLKEKLSNMMKLDGSDVINTYSKDKQNDVHGQKDIDDEEDLALLRQKALETKQKKPVKMEQVKPKEEKKTTCLEEDHDDEDLELRMIALRSAVMKKHQDRVQRGVKSRKVKSPSNRTESPFTQSFLDSIPIPSEKPREDSVSPPHPLEDTINTEDMDLDTDVEMEKERLPYSPTDNITTEIPLDTEMLGIQPSDVSFINVNKTESSPQLDHNLKNNLDHTPEIIKNKSFLPKTELPYFDANTDAPYSPSDSIETSKDYMSISSCQSNNMLCNMKVEKDTKVENHAVDDRYNAVDGGNQEERPYSPTDAPLYDPDLSQTLPSSLHSSYVSNASCLTSIESTYAGNLCGSMSLTTKMFENPQLQYVQEREMIETFASNSHQVTPPVISSVVPSVPTANAIIPVDQLSTAKVIVPPCIDMIPQNMESITSHERLLAQEPLYMQGIPDVTKDANKIPTLINRTLVPAPILKTNKQLQQPLPIKTKQESHIEPTFKNAEMQPVPIQLNTNVNVSIFKPIRLVPIAKKPQTILNSVTTSFQNCLNDDTMNTVSSDYTEDFRNAAVLQIKAPEKSTKRIISTPEVTAKRKRHRRRSGRRRGSNNTQSNNNKSLNNSKNDDATVAAAAAAASTAPNNNNNKNSNNKNLEELDKDTKQDKSVVLKESLVKSQGNEISSTYKDRNDGSVVSPHVNHSVTATKSLQRSRSLSPSHEKELNNKDTSIASIEKQKTDDPPECKTSATRRPSLDEDEEALRAILLASLAKRTKPSDTNSTTNVPPVTTIATGLNYTPPIDKTQASGVSNIPEKLSEKQVTASAITNINEKNQTNATNVSNNDMIRKHDQNKNIEKIRAVTSVTTTAARKRSLSSSRSPARKFVKKVSIPASAKVVNNAKKYQNTLVQRKLNLQKTASLYKTENTVESKPISVTSSTLKINDTKWTNNQTTKPAISSDTQRIVISLGSDSESDSEQEDNSVPSSNSNPKMEKRQMLTIPTSEFEKSVDQFLKDVRKKQENAIANKQQQQSLTTLYNTAKKNTSTSTVLVETKTTTNVHTPLAVRHLPVSQQEEYRRLKQQIIEYEKLKLKRSVENAASKHDKNKNNSKTTHTSTSDSAISSPKDEQTRLQTANTKLSGKQNIIENVDATKSAHVPTVSTVAQVSNVISKQSNSRTLSKTAASSTKVSSPRVQTLRSNAKKGILKNNDNKTIDNTESENNQIEEHVNTKKYASSAEQVVEFRKEETNTNSVVDDIEKLDPLNITPSVVNQDMKDNTKNDTILESPNKVGNQENCNLSNIDSEANLDRLVSRFNKTNMEEFWETIRRDVKIELDSLIDLPRLEQERHLMDTEHKLVLKRYMVLDDLAEMSENLRQWDIERDLQTDLVEEVKRLREQLRIAEEKLKVHRNRINNMGPKVMAAHGKINEGRRECFKLTRICMVLGTKVIGQDYKLPEAGAHLLDNKVKEVANHTRQLSKKKVPSVNSSVSPVQLRKDTEHHINTANTELTQENSSAPTPQNTSECHSEYIVKIPPSAENDLSPVNVEKSLEQTEVKIEQEEIKEERIDVVCEIGDSIPQDNQPQENNNTQDGEMTEIGSSDTLQVNAVKEEPIESHNSRKAVKPYVSMLTHLKVPRNTNPNGVLCPYELMGTCNDGECQFIHHSAGHRT